MGVACATTFRWSMTHKICGVYLSLRATDKLMTKLFRITFYILNLPNVQQEKRLTKAHVT